MPAAWCPPDHRGQVLPFPRRPAGPDSRPGPCVRGRASGHRRPLHPDPRRYRRTGGPGRRALPRGAGRRHQDELRRLRLPHGPAWLRAPGRRGTAAAPAPARRWSRPCPLTAARRGVSRVRAAAHRSPSVGLSQPWDFIVITDRARRERIKALAARAAGDYAASLPAARATAFDRLKIEAILEAPVAVV